MYSKPMPEYPDITLYLEALEQRILGKTLQAVSLRSPFLLRTATLMDGVQKLRDHYGERFPDKVTAFREDMAVHGRTHQPCPVCHTLVQRICCAANDTNYCPTCQTEGKILADRTLSRLLKKDWPRTVDELEKM